MALLFKRYVHAPRPRPRVLYRYWSDSKTTRGIVFLWFISFSPVRPGPRICLPALFSHFFLSCLHRVLYRLAAVPRGREPPHDSLLLSAEGPVRPGGRWRRWRRAARRLRCLGRHLALRRRRRNRCICPSYTLLSRLGCYVICWRC